jgi:hypothetical protein
MATEKIEPRAVEIAEFGRNGLGALWRPRMAARHRYWSRQESGRSHGRASGIRNGREGQTRGRRALLAQTGAKRKGEAQSRGA